MDQLKKLMEWYSCQCNGDWEHQYGICLQTIDNPGWQLEIDLSETILCGREFPDFKLENGEEDWYFCRVRNEKFEGFCSINRIEDVMSKFFLWVEEAS